MDTNPKTGNSSRDTQIKPIVQDIEQAVQRIIREQGISVLLVEQHLHFVRQADRYYAMQRGGIVASGPTTELSQDVVEKFLSV